MITLRTYHIQSSIISLVLENASLRTNQIYEDKQLQHIFEYLQSKDIATLMSKDYTKRKIAHQFGQKKHG